MIYAVHGSRSRDWITRSVRRERSVTRQLRAHALLQAAQQEQPTLMRT